MYKMIYAGYSVFLFILVYKKLNTGCICSYLAMRAGTLHKVRLSIQKTNSLCTLGLFSCSVKATFMAS